MIVSMGASILIMLAIPMLIGKLVIKNENILEQYLMGFAVCMAIFEVICIPMNLLEIDFLYLCIVYGILIGLLCIISILKSNKKNNNIVSKNKVDIIFALAVGIIIYQIIRVVICTPAIYGDDIAYITMVNDIKSTNIIHGLDYFNGRNIDVIDVSHKYLFTTYYQLLAVLSKITALHPLILCKTILPIFYMVMSYMVVWLVSGLLFEKKNSREIFLFLYAVLIEVGNYSYYTISRRTLVWSWNSKSVLFTILLPFLFYYANKVSGNIKSKDMLELAVLVTACCATTLMGAGLSPIMLLSLGFVFAVRNRNYKSFIQMGICSMPAIVILILDVLYGVGR